MADLRRIRQSLNAMGVEAKQRFIEAVADLGQEALQYAFYKRNMGKGPRPKEASENKLDAWYSEQGNLHDSLGSAVYVNGVLQPDTIRYVDDEIWMKRPDPRYRAGRKVLNEYFRKVKPISKRNEVFLMVVAAMPYSRFLESGTHFGGYKIHVISEARTYIDKHWHGIEGRVYANMGLRKPATRVVAKGDTQTLRDAGYDSKGHRL